MLIPILGKNIRENDYISMKKNISKTILICLIIGILISTIFAIFSDQITSLIYGNNYGSDLIRRYSFFFIIYYIEHPIITCLSILNESKKAFSSTVISSIARIILMFLLIEKMEIDGLCISIILSTYIDVFLNIFYLIRFFIRNNHCTIRFHKH